MRSAANGDRAGGAERESERGHPLQVVQGNPFQGSDYTRRVRGDGGSPRRSGLGARRAGRRSRVRRAGAAAAASTRCEIAELKTYDWRLTHTARPDTARKDIALVEIDEYSLRNLQPYAGRWPWPRVVHAMLLDYLARAPAKLVVYDVNFAEPDTRTRLRLRRRHVVGRRLRPGAGRGGQGGRQRHPARRRHLQRRVRRERRPAGHGIRRRPRRAPSSAASSTRRLPALAHAGSALGHNFFVLDPDGPLRHTVPFAQVGSRTSCRRSASPRRSAAAGIAPQRCPVRRRSARHGRSRDAARRGAASGARTASRAISGGSSIFAARRCSAISSSAPTRRYSFFDLAAAEQEILNDRKPAIDPALFRDRIVFVGTTASGLFDVFETPFSNGRMPGINIHAAVADDVLSNRFIREASRGRPRRDGRCGRAGRRRRRDDAAGVVGDRGDRRVHRRAGLGRHAGVRRRLLAESVAAGAGLVVRAVRRRRRTSTSSKGARSGR